LPRPGSRLLTRIPYGATGDVACAFSLPLQRIQTDSMDEGAWALLLLLPYLVLGRLEGAGEGGTQDLMRRCWRFEASWRVAVFARAEFRTRAAADVERREHRGPLSAADEDAQRLQRCLALCRVGELSRAAHALEPARMAPDTDDTLQTLRDLNPAAPHDIPAWVLEFEPPEAFELDPLALHWALMTAPRLSAAGLSGALYEHYRDILLEDTTIFSQFHDICSHVARGQLPPRARSALSSSRLLAMAKPVVDGPDGVRPIAIAEVFQRLISRAIALQMRDTFQEYFSPLQYAVATPAGCKTIVAGVRALLEADPELLVLQVDMANAFNEVDRVAIFEELRAHFPALLPFARLFYAHSSSLQYTRQAGTW
jgi:hypothetical protein